MCQKKINSWLLMKPYCNKSGLVTTDRAISTSLNIVYPFIAHNIHRWLVRDQVSHFFKGIELMIHSFSPFNRFRGLSVAARLLCLKRRKKCCGYLMLGGKKKFLLFEDITFALSVHGTWKHQLCGSRCCG